MKPLKNYTRRHIAAWSVHFFTALSAVTALFSLIAISEENWVMAFYWMGVAVVIDALDGTLARLAHVRTVLPNIDGALLDNMMDFINYVLVPCFLMVKAGIFPPSAEKWVIGFILIASCYQFTQTDAKTSDHFFKGFPSYWNFVAFYAFIYQASPVFNAIVITFFAVLVFIPIKYIYPSRIQYISRSLIIKALFVVSCILFGIISFAILWYYPSVNRWLIHYSQLFVVFYFAFSLYRTFFPLTLQTESTT